MVWSLRFKDNQIIYFLTNLKQEKTMDTRKRFFMAALALGAVVFLLAGVQARADAFVVLSGADSNQGTIDLTTGTYTLWGLLGGSTSTTTTTSGSGTTITYGDITTTTPVGDNSKNAILRDYLVVTGSGGQQSVVSLGEIDPNFVGTTASNSAELTVSGTTASLTFLGSGASGRDISNVTSVQLLSVAALPGPLSPTPESTTVTLSGNTSNAGSYDLSQLESDFTPTTEVVNSDTYTGVPLWTFLNPNDSDILDQYVAVAGTDGYEVVYSLAELDPSLGGNPSDLLPYADTGGNFPSDGVARTLTPSDQPYAHGRWDSDVATVGVEAAPVPEPGSITLFASGLTTLIAFCRKRRTVAGGGV
jgi:hypothetical protein